MSDMYLSHKGYVIPKAEFSEEKLQELKNALTVKPFVIEGYGPTDTENLVFKTYRESSSKLYIPKNYGLKRFGAVETRLQSGNKIDLEFNGKLRPLQTEAVEVMMEACENKMGGLLCLQCGEGKCLGKDTPVMMYNGTIKPVQEIRVGDVLMGDDSTERHVLSISRGMETMYRITQNYGDPYIVNESHILSLKNSKGHIVDISVKEYLEHGICLYGYKPDYVQFTHAEEIPDAYRIAYNSKWSSIPLEFKCGTEKVRFAVFTAMLNKYGLVTDHYNRETVLYVILDTLRKDIVFVARSLGLYAVENVECNKIILYKNIDLIYPITVEKMSVDYYYGFEIDNNRRFLLGDFTVTHNTICAINLICRLARKALIVVHKEFLLTQWKERIAEFAPDASIGIIKGKILNVEHKDIVIASLQSLAMKDYEDSVFESFGTIVIDECHHTGAQVFSQALRKYTFRYSIGLTATPKRKDGLTKVFTWFLGDIAYQTKKRDDELQVVFKDYYHISPDYSREHTLYTKRPNIARMINSICEFTPRIEFVVDQVKAILAEEPSRKVLLLSDRRIHLQLLKDAFEKTGIEAGLYYGGLAPWQLKESEEKQILLGTFNYISEGFDMKGLDTLVLASPKSDVVQIVGRILRDKPEDRKHMPMVLDIIDNFSVFQGQAQKRYNYYKKCGYEILNYAPIVKTINLTPGKCLL